MFIPLSKVIQELSDKYFYQKKKEKKGRYKKRGLSQGKDNQRRQRKQKDFNQ